MKRAGALFLILSACANAQPGGPMPSLPEMPQSSSSSSPSSPITVTATIALPHREVAARIIDAALASSGAYEKLERLTDDIGHRLSGSPALARAVEWGVATMSAEGLENVRAEKVMVPFWERGVGRGAIVAPSLHTLDLLALGGSGGAPKFRAEVVVLSTLEELESRQSEVKDRIVLFNRAMPAYSKEKGPGYGETVPIRSSGPSRAAKYGAKAALVRSVTAKSLRTSHTGATRFEPDQTPIPAAAVTIEDAELIARLARRGKVEIELEIGSKTHPDVESANVIGELVGREKPEEIVLLGAHLDSWDVGQGAHDDGAGCVAVIEALALLKKLGLQPRRTLRAVLYTNEENGLRGAKVYAERHRETVHVAAIEMDTGGFAPLGFRVESKGPPLQRVRDLAGLLAKIGATRVVEGGAGADVSTLAGGTAVLLGLDVDTEKYFDYHHSDADTFDKVNRDELQADVAAMAVMGYVLAETPERVGGR